MPRAWGDDRPRNPDKLARLAWKAYEQILRERHPEAGYVLAEVTRVERSRQPVQAPMSGQINRGLVRPDDVNPLG
jgi:hypothetical protein